MRVDFLYFEECPVIRDDQARAALGNPVVRKACSPALKRGADRELRTPDLVEMGEAETLIAVLLAVVAGLSTLARRLPVPYRSVLVVGLKPPVRERCGEPAAHENAPPPVCGIRHGPEQ